MSMGNAILTSLLISLARDVVVPPLLGYKRARARARGGRPRLRTDVRSSGVRGVSDPQAAVTPPPPHMSFRCRLRTSTVDWPSRKRRSWWPRCQSSSRLQYTYLWGDCHCFNLPCDSIEKFYFCTLVCTVTEILVRVILVRPDQNPQKLPLRFWSGRPKSPRILVRLQTFWSG